jgi:deferrochelatase/peroxidase EfeB
MLETTRRGLLAGAGAAAGIGAGVVAAGIGAAGIEAALAPAAAAASAAAGDGRMMPFWGEHQAGIATETPEHVHFLALDVVSDARADLQGVLVALSAAAVKLVAGHPVGAVDTGAAPAVDTGEALGLGPARLTLTFGLGPGVFAHGRFGLERRRPKPLVELPAFATDALEPSICGGDIAVQACAEDPQVAFHAIHDLIRLASPAAVPRWSLAGFGRTLNRRSGATPRNLLGFKEGTGNVMSQDAAALERYVWAGRPASPAWMEGGSYMVVRRITVQLANWDSIPLFQQESTFGRPKLSGAPIGERQEFAPLDLSARRDGQPLIAADAHVRLASPQYNAGERLLRRGYSFVAGVDAARGTLAAGQLFICFGNDPRRQFIPIQRRLAAADALNEHIAHVGSAIFACPPGAALGGFVGAGLFN